MHSLSIFYQFGNRLLYGCQVFVYRDEFELSLRGIQKPMQYESRAEKKSNTISARTSAVGISKLFKDRRREHWQAGLPSYLASHQSEPIPHIVAVGGAKGGVGKSILSANLAAKLACHGHRVLLIDLDLGSANLHTYFGLPMPSASVADVLAGAEQSLESVFVETPVDGLLLAPGGRDDSWAPHMDAPESVFGSFWQRILQAKSKWNIDFVILDLGAGSHPLTIDFFSIAHLGITTVLPEPTSIENAYSFLKATLWRLAANVSQRMNSGPSAGELKKFLFSDADGVTTDTMTTFEKLKSLSDQHPKLVEMLLGALKGRQLGVVVNQVRSQRDIDIGPSMGHISRRFFGMQASSIGFLNYDDAAWKSLRNRRLLVLDFPHSILARRVHEVAMRIRSDMGYD